jgi:hypothetical protein
MQRLRSHLPWSVGEDALVIGAATGRRRADARL